MSGANRTASPAHCPEPLRCPMIVLDTRAPMARTRHRQELTSVAYDITALRALFPALSGGTAHFDGPGGTQTPRPVIEAITRALANPLSNRGQVTAGERNADTIVTGAR